MKKLIILSFALAILLVSCEAVSVEENGARLADENNTPTPIIDEITTPDEVPEASMPADSADDKYIGEARARTIALNKAGLQEKDVTFTKTKLDFDDGIWQYEVEFRRGNTEYDVDIKADDGTILSYDIDVD